ncbi:Ig-like domain-containing protein [Salinisphaera orenii]|nr:Ig-like domain-containing protein [Salinisphaera orenii]
MISTYSCASRAGAQATSELNPDAAQPRRRAHSSWPTRVGAIVLMSAAGLVLPACSSGSGGDNGDPNPREDVTPTGLAFSYPFDGQQDVLLDTQMVVKFAGDVGDVPADALVLRYEDDDGDTVTQPLTVRADDDDEADQAGILCLALGSDVELEDGRDDFCLQGGPDLRPDTDYAVVASSTIADSGTSFEDGQTLFRFTTRPAEGRPAPGDFRVTSVTPGDTNPETGDQSLFTEFNAIRVIFNEPLDPATVDGDSFTVTGPDDEDIDDARVTALGRYIVFDPSEDLEPGDYTIAWSSDITSRFGKSLEADSVERTVLSVGDSLDQTLTIERDTTGTDIDELPDNNLNGLATNNVEIGSQLIGSNDQPVLSPDDVDSRAGLIRTGIETTLAEPGLSGFGDVFPAVIRAGQRFQLKGLTLELGGEIATPIDPSGPIDVNFINDVSVYLSGNDYRNIETPTAVRLRFDLGIGTLITAMDQENLVVQQLANGVFNQSVLNIQAAGLAIPRDNGDLEISTLGSFPINVNRSDNATVDFELTLLLPADDDDQIDVPADEVPPTVTAVSPSACLYTFGSPLYDAVYADRGAPPTALPEPACRELLGAEAQQGGRSDALANTFQVESSPAVTFSSPIDPASVSPSSIVLTGPSGDVDATYRVEGFSVVVDPEALLSADTEYRIMLNNGDQLTDLAGNPVSFQNPAGPSQSIDFRTEPLIETEPTAPLLGTLTPGIPCALEGGDFMSGGDSAGHCVGDNPGNDEDGGDAASEDFPVFDNPANVAIEGFFSKLVESDSIVLADGCLVNGSGNTDADATVAVQRMDDSGQCVAAVEGEIALANRGDDLTRGFTFRPTRDFEPGARYWVVVCGGDGASACSNRIVDADGRALNTDPLNGTGSTPAAADAEGGPDIVMPFTATAATEDYFATQATFPYADTNGNGRFDDGENAQPGNRTRVELTTELLGTEIQIPGEQDDGSFASYLSLTRPIAIRESTGDCEDVDTDAVGGTPGSCIPVSLQPGGINALTSINISADALGGILTQVLRVDELTAALGDLLGNMPEGTTVGDINDMDDAGGPLDQLTGGLNQLVGGVTDVLIPVIGDGQGGSADDMAVIELIGALQRNEVTAPLGNTLAGLINSETPVGALPGLVDGLVDDLLGTLLGGLAGQDEPLQTGRVLLRFPNDADADGEVPQTGYIVEECEGSIDGQPYHYEPCFTASLTLTANAPDGQGVSLPQQQIRTRLVGPVTFEQNGRLAIALRNVNRFSLSATALDLLPANATVDPGDLNFQLTGAPVHGGREFPNR